MDGQLRLLLKLPLFAQDQFFNATVLKDNVSFFRLGYHSLLQLPMYPVPKRITVLATDEPNTTVKNPDSLFSLEI